jgi:hypothetical protein
MQPQAQPDAGKLRHHGYLAANFHAAMPSAGRCMSHGVLASACRACPAAEDEFESADSAGGGYASAASNVSSELAPGSASAAAAARAAQLDARAAAVAAKNAALKQSLAEAEAKRQVPGRSVSSALPCNSSGVAAGWYGLGASTAGGHQHQPAEHTSTLHEL